MAFRIQFCLTISEFAIQHFANKQKRRETYSQAVGSLLFLQSSVKNNIPHLVKHPHQRGACHSFGKHRQKQSNQNEGLPNDFYREPDLTDRKNMKELRMQNQKGLKQ